MRADDGGNRHERDPAQLSTAKPSHWKGEREGRMKA
jgi:hypothetical protein